MADCSYYRCIQERRFVKRELQKWSKDMVYIVGECLPFIYLILLGTKLSKWTRFFCNPLYPINCCFLKLLFSLFFVRSFFQPQPRMLWKLSCRLCLMLCLKQKTCCRKSDDSPENSNKYYSGFHIVPRLAFVCIQWKHFDAFTSVIFSKNTFFRGDQTHYNKEIVLNGEVILRVKEV